MSDNTTTVIIPTYNRESTLLRSINSVLSQTFSVDEIIVVDDGSTDNTEQLVSSINDNRIRYIKQDNSGANAARNHGIECASCFWVAFQDSDDVWLPHKCETIHRKISELRKRKTVNLSEIALFHSFVRRVDESCEIEGSSTTVPAGLLRKYPEGIDSTIDRFDQLSILLGNFMSSQTMFLPTKTLKSLGGFDETIKRYTDWELSIKIADKMKMIFISDTLGIQFIQDSSISNNIEEGHIARRQIFNKHKSIYRKRPYIYARQSLRMYYRALFNK